jgi:hypothetical protein
MTSPTISKSKFLSGIQCPLLLWTQYNDRGVIPPTNAGTQYIFDMGHSVGDLAKQLWPNGVEVPAGGADRPDLDATVVTTREYLKKRKPIFEASFVSDEPGGRRYVRADVMLPVLGEDRWDLVEVKSSTRTKDVNIWDVAFQAGAIEGAGVKLRRLSLMHINTSYVRQGPIEPARLFATDDITELARNRMRDVPRMFAEYAATISGPKPVVPIGPHCVSPYTCAMKDVCWNHLPEHHVTTMVRAGKKAFDWVERGIHDVADIPNRDLAGAQRVQKDAVKSGRPVVDQQAIHALLDSLEYPLWHLDFESVNPAVPLFNGTRPFQQVPFQFSLHVEEAPGAEPEHIEFLSVDSNDPRPALLEALSQIGPYGTVLAFNATFESQVLATLGATFPEWKTMTDDLGARLRDLADPFRTFSVYHPGQKGSYSLKSVLPALTGAGYEGLAIADGQAAGRQWLQAVYKPDLSEAAREGIFEGLRAYCGKDTGAMVEILEVLRGMI